MVKKRQGRYFLIIPRADHLIAAPMPNGLFSIEKGCLHYDAHVEANLSQQEVPKEEDEEEEEQAGPEQEQLPPNPYTTYKDMYALEGNIQNMSNLAINL
jgi:hypothetical protein